MITGVMPVTEYMNKAYQFKLIGKVRSAIMFSVLSIIMKHVNGVYTSIDIIMVAITVNFVCALLHSVVLANVQKRRLFHCGYILRSISRQSVLVISSAVADRVHMRDIGTQNENTMLLVVSTTAFIAFVTCIPPWFLQDAQQGSIKDLLIYSFTTRYKQLHIPGLGDSTGIGTLVYGLLFVVTTLADGSTNHKTEISAFMKTLQQAASMIFSNLFITRVVPEYSRQVLPIAILLAMYIVSNHIPMSGPVSAFVLWRTAAEVSSWTARMLPGGDTDRIILYGLLVFIVPTVDSNVSSVLAVAAIQTFVGVVMKSMMYLGTVGTVLSSVCVLLVTDIVLDAR